MFGGLFVAAVKINDTVTTIFGIIIAVAIALDQLFGNHARMMAETIAATAIDRITRRVGNEFNHRVVEVKSAQIEGNAREAEIILTELARTSSKNINDEMDKIKTAVEDNNIELLGKLSIDNK